MGGGRWVMPVCLSGCTVRVSGVPRLAASGVVAVWPRCSATWFVGQAKIARNKAGVRDSIVAVFLAFQ
jgi:hypothetical protein